MTDVRHLALCKHCGKQIEETDGLLYPWTHCDPNQRACFVAEPQYPVGNEKYCRDDFSPEAIEWRFSCGSWGELDVRYIVAALQRLQTLEKYVHEAMNPKRVEGGTR